MDAVGKEALALSAASPLDNLHCQKSVAGDLRTLVAACASVSGEQLVEREKSSSPEVENRNGALEKYEGGYAETSSKARADIRALAVLTMTSKSLPELGRMALSFGSESGHCPDGLMQLRQAFQPYLGSDVIQGDQHARGENISAAAKQSSGDGGLLYSYVTDAEEPAMRKGIDGLKLTLEQINKWSPSKCVSEEEDVSNPAKYKKNGLSSLVTDDLSLRPAREGDRGLVERREEDIPLDCYGGGPASTSSEELDAELGERPRKRKAIQDVLQNIKVPEVRVLIEKLLTISDTDKRGCIALPKGPVEEHLPALDRKEGMELQCEDVTGQQWTFQFRFWTLKHHRTYILQHTLDYVRAHKIVAGDTLQLCRAASGKLVIKVRRGKSVGRSGLGHKWGGHKMGSAHKYGTLQLTQKPSGDHGAPQDGEGRGLLMIELPGSKTDQQRDGEIARKDAGVLVKGFLAAKRKVDTGGESFWERGWSSVQKRSPHQKRKLWGSKGAEAGFEAHASDSNAVYAEKSSGSGGTGGGRHEGGMAMADAIQQVDQQKRTCSGSEDTDEDWQPDGQKALIRKARRAMSAGRPRRNTVPMQWLMSDYDVCEKQSRKRKAHGDLDALGVATSADDALRGKEMDVCSREHHSGSGCGCDGHWRDPEGEEAVELTTVKKLPKKAVDDSQRPRLMLEQCCAWKIVGQPGCPETAASGSAYCWQHMPSKHQKQGGTALLLGDVPKKMSGKQKRGPRGPRGLVLVPWRGREASKLMAKAWGRARKERLAESTELKVVENEESEFEMPVGVDAEKMEMEVGPLVGPEKPVERELLCNKGNGGKTWRCGRKRIPGRVFCEVHAKNLKKSSELDKPAKIVKEGGTGGKQTARKAVDAREVNIELPPEGQRCNKSNGAKSWRCSRFRLPGRAFCEVHCTFPKSDRSERRVRYGASKALATVPTGYVADVCMGGLDRGESSHVSAEQMVNVPLGGVFRECAFVGGHQPCSLPAEPGHLACVRHMKPGMMRQARLLKKAKFSGKPCKDDGRGSADEEAGVLRLESPANMNTSPPELTLASPDMGNIRWWTRTSKIPDSMVALAHAASQASMEDAVLKAGKFSGASEDATAEEQATIVTMMRRDRGLEARPSLSMLGDFALSGGGKSNSTMEEKLQMYRDGQVAQETDREVAWVDDKLPARRGAEGGRLSPEEGTSMAASAITFSRQELFADGRGNVRQRGMAAMFDASKYDCNGSPIPGGESRLASSLDVDRSSLSGITHSGIVAESDLNKQLGKRPEMRGLQLSRSALGSVYSRWGNSEEMQVRRVAPSAAWQDRLPERPKEAPLTSTDVNGRLPVPLDDGSLRSQADCEITDSRSRLPPRKRQGLQLFGVYLQGGTPDEQQHDTIPPVLQQSQPPASGSGLKDVFRSGEVLNGSKASPWWLGVGDGLGIRDPVVPVTEPRWLSSSSIHRERENGLLGSGGERQLQCAKMDSTFRWRCNIPAIMGSKFCQEHAQESLAADAVALPPYALASEAAPSSMS